jgi:hypothetical protein
MFYTIYRITNILDGKIYIGKHQTKDLNDGYMGSGKRLKYAQTKHGIENFKKEILFQFDNEAEMNDKEAELVTEEFCLRENTYNLCVGGQGGFSHINRDIELRIAKNRKARMTTNTIHSNNLYKWCAAGAKSKYEKHGLSEKFIEKRQTSFLNKSHSVESKTKIGEANSKMIGQLNSQFGTMWITNGQENKKIKKIDIIPEGWYKGRINKNMLL